MLCTRLRICGDGKALKHMNWRGCSRESVLAQSKDQPAVLKLIHRTHTLPHTSRSDCRQITKRKTKLKKTHTHTHTLENDADVCAQHSHGTLYETDDYFSVGNSRLKCSAIYLVATDRPHAKRTQSK